MAIDMHYHLFTGMDNVRCSMMLGEAAFFADELTRLGSAISAEEMEQRVYPTWVDPDGKKLLQSMDEAGIAQACLLVATFDPDPAMPDQRFRQKNRETGEVVAKHPSRLVGYCGISPFCHDAVGLIEEAVRLWGMRGIKLDPLSGGFALDDEALYPIYGKASDLGLLVMAHTGPRPEAGSSSDYAHPSRLSRPLAEFPALKLIAAHVSFSWWRELIAVGQERPNLMCDISALQLGARGSLGRFRSVLRRVLDGMGPQRVLFGSDGPAFDLFISRKDWVQLIESLPLDSNDGLAFTREEVSAILEGNARRLLAGGEPS